MKKGGVAMVVAGCFLFSINVWAVKAPSVETRVEAEKHHDKVEKKKLKEQRASGCAYGKDKVTGKCYQPKPGQVYTDPATGETKMKDWGKINVPWGKKDKSTSKKEKEKP